MKKSIKGSHSTFIDESKIIIDILEKYKVKYSLGIIKTGLKKSTKFIKLKKTEKNFFVICRDNISLQEIVIYSRNITYEQLKRIILNDKKILKKTKKGLNIFTDE